MLNIYIYILYVKYIYILYVKYIYIYYMLNILLKFWESLRDIAEQPEILWMFT